MAWPDDMAAAAMTLLAAVPDAALPFADDRRTDWSYLPLPRHGAHIARLDQDQRLLVHALLHTALSTEAYAQVCSIVALEDVLNVMEAAQRRPQHRHHGNYWVAVYGRPGDPAWGWSFEGHHVSVNLTVVGDRVLPTPLFLGANPHEFVIRPLGWEEDYGRLVARHTPAAVLAGEAPHDILTAQQVAVATEAIEPLGVRGADLSAEGLRYLEALVRVYTARVRHAPAAPDVRDVHFAWLGSVDHGRPHYYRVQGPGFLVEYDNTQNGANHSHTVWRTPGDDFGATLLRNHHDEEHA